MISIMAVLAGADGPKAIGVWAKSLEHRLKDRLQLPSGVPWHDTIGRVSMMLKPAAFQSSFERWIKRVSDNRQEGELYIVAIDGKAVRRSHDCSAGLGPLFLVSAWAVKRGVSLGQLATEEKSNEITATPELSRHYISSPAVGVKRFAECVRGHWGIENTLHWCLDVTFREDESRVRN